MIMLGQAAKEQMETMAKERRFRSAIIFVSGLVAGVSFGAAFGSVFLAIGVVAVIFCFSAIVMQAASE